MMQFNNDYLEGVHPEILQKLIETNMEKTSGYGTDEYTISAKNKIKNACKCKNAEVFFLVGGTQTNATVLDSLLRKGEGVISVSTGHINVHESGAVENTGHKVLALEQSSNDVKTGDEDTYKETQSTNDEMVKISASQIENTNTEIGKLSASQIEKYLKDFYSDDNYEHAVIPGAVYISHPTEYGTLYTKNELKSIHEVCKKYGIPLFLDGARLGYGLAASNTDVDLPTLAKYCDSFYIGGTKVGAYEGEAVVFTKPNLVKHFVNSIKRHGALLAKGRFLGIQFDTFFTNDLYYRCGKNGVDMANKLRETLKEKGYKLFAENPTNQVFVILANEKMKELAKKVVFSVWEKADESHTVVRFATSWATTIEDLDALCALL